MTEGSALETARGFIDSIDTSICSLLKHRESLSAAIQRHRTEHGGNRLSHQREVEIVNRYHERLGEGGTDVALAILNLCRGKTEARSDRTGK